MQYWVIYILKNEIVKAKGPFETREKAELYGEQLKKIHIPPHMGLLEWFVAKRD